MDGLTCTPEDLAYSVSIHATLRCFSYAERMGLVVGGPNLATNADADFLKKNQVRRCRWLNLSAVCSCSFWFDYREYDQQSMPKLVRETLTLGQRNVVREWQPGGHRRALIEKPMDVYLVRSLLLHSDV